MPILKRNTQSATTAQPTGSGAVPGQRETAEGTKSPESTEYRQTGVRPAEEYGESAEARTGTRDRYGMAGTLMTLTGLLTFFLGITGIIAGAFFGSETTYPFYFSVRSRGILLLVIGAVALCVGLALLVRMRRAREVAIVVAALSAIANFMFLPFYPFWSIIVLVLDVLIIWELTRDRVSREFARLPCPPRVVSGWHLSGLTALGRRPPRARSRGARLLPSGIGRMPTRRPRSLLGIGAFCLRDSRCRLGECAWRGAWQRKRFRVSCGDSQTRLSDPGARTVCSWREPGTYPFGRETPGCNNRGNKWRNT